MHFLLQVIFHHTLRNILKITSFAEDVFSSLKDGVEKRNHDYASIVRQLTFHKHSVPKEVPSPRVQRAAVSSTALQRPTHTHADLHFAGSEQSADFEDEEVGVSRGLQRAELLVWVGDFNYRVDMSYHEALEAIQQNQLREMLKKDQCRREMSRNRVFHGLREGDIQFQPTYKFDKGLQNPLAYDSSEKMRVPSWTDRIFFRGSKPFRWVTRKACSRRNTFCLILPASTLQFILNWL